MALQWYLLELDILNINFLAGNDIENNLLRQ